MYKNMHKICKNMWEGAKNEIHPVKLGHVGSSWLKVGPSWPQDMVVLAQVGLKIPKMASQGLQQANLA